SRSATGSASAATRMPCPCAWSRSSSARAIAASMDTGDSAQRPVLLQAAFDAAAGDPVAADHEDERDDDADPRVRAVTPDRVSGRMAAVVRDEADRGRPDDPAERVPEEEPPPPHPSEARDPRGGEPEDGDEAS